MKYHTLFFSKIMKDAAKLSSAAVVIDALRVNSSNALVHTVNNVNSPFTFDVHKIHTLVQELFHRSRIYKYYCIISHF